MDSLSRNFGSRDDGLSLGGLGVLASLLMLREAYHEERLTADTVCGSGASRHIDNTCRSDAERARPSIMSDSAAGATPEGRARVDHRQRPAPGALTHSLSRPGPRSPPSPRHGDALALQH